MSRELGVWDGYGRNLWHRVGIFLVFCFVLLSTDCFSTRCNPLEDITVSNMNRLNPNHFIIIFYENYSYCMSLLL